MSKIYTHSKCLSQIELSITPPPPRVENFGNLITNSCTPVSRTIGGAV